MKLFSRLRTGFSVLKPGSLALRAARCPFCGPSLFVRLNDSEAGVRCEDVQALTWPDASFDLVTHSEVFEHVPDDRRGFSELRRVLRRGGKVVFTVPLFDAAQTVKRAELGPNGVVHLLPPAYHVDPFKGNEPVLVFRDYGRDIKDRLEQAGFGEVKIETPAFSLQWVQLRPVIYATAV